MKVLEILRTGTLNHIPRLSFPPSLPRYLGLLCCLWAVYFLPYPFRRPFFSICRQSRRCLQTRCVAGDRLWVSVSWNAWKSIQARGRVNVRVRAPVWSLVPSGSVTHPMSRYRRHRPRHDSLSERIVTFDIFIHFQPSAGSLGWRNRLHVANILLLLL